MTETEYLDNVLMWDGYVYARASFASDKEVVYPWDVIQDKFHFVELYPNSAVHQLITVGLN